MESEVMADYIFFIGISDFGLYLKIYNRLSVIH